MALERESFVIEADKPTPIGCGIVARTDPSGNIADMLETGLRATEGVWHRGQQGLGNAIQTQEGIEHRVIRGTMDQAFPYIVSEFKGMTGPSPWGLFHCLYGTNGGYGNENLQPIVVNTPEGQLAVIHNGQFVGELAGDSPEKRDGISDTNKFAHMLAKEEGNSWEERVVSALSKAKGAYSLAIGVGDKLFIARDPQGIRPFVLGKMGEGWIAASETLALDKAGVEPLRMVRAGEIIRIDNNGLKVIKDGDGAGNFCDFEEAYFMDPNSRIPLSHEDNDHPERWISLLSLRQRWGEAMFEETREIAKRADFIVGVPDSGIPFATGYANASGLKYIPAIRRDHYTPDRVGRTFQQYGFEDIERRVMIKQSINPDPNIWRGRVVIVLDDSIVRSKVSAYLTKLMFSFGAAEVHWMSSFHKVRHICFTGIDMRTLGELVASRNDGYNDRIAREIGATSVNYLSSEGFIRAKRKELIVPENPREIYLANDGCGGCITGLYPISREGIIYQTSSKGKHLAL